MDSTVYVLYNSMPSDKVSMHSACGGPVLFMQQLSFSYSEFSTVLLYNKKPSGFSSFEEKGDGCYIIIMSNKKREHNKRSLHGEST